MDIAIIGAGNIGGTLGRKWAASGHRITFGVRDPHKSEVERLVADLGPDAGAMLIADAVARGEVVLFAIPGRIMAETVSALDGAIDGKVVFDATNNIGAGAFNSISALSSVAPRAHIYRAFNTYGWENFETPVFGGTAADLLYAGPDGEPRNVAERLISEVGLRPVWLGGLDRAGLVDSLLPVWFTLSSERGFGRHFAFKILSADGN
jgi:predicted dinucleotide-binding enzyme